MSETTPITDVRDVLMLEIRGLREKCISMEAAIYGAKGDNGMNKKSRNTVAMLLVMMMLGVTSVLAAAKQQLPDPDGKPADMSKPVQVYILMGQSNMLGAGKIDPADKPGSLTHAVT